MMPGMPGKMNPRQMNQLMKRFGIDVKEIPNVEKVVIQTDTKEYVFEDAEVTVMKAQGTRTYQIAGTPSVHDREEEVRTDDIKLVMEQAGVSEEEAKKALEASDGDIAEAILKLSG